MKKIHTGDIRDNPILSSYLSKFEIQMLFHVIKTIPLILERKKDLPGEC